MLGPGRRGLGSGAAAPVYPPPTTRGRTLIHSGWSHYVGFGQKRKVPGSFGSGVNVVLILAGTGGPSGVLYLWAHEVVLGEPSLGSRDEPLPAEGLPWYQSSPRRTLCCHRDQISSFLCVTGRGA